MPSPLLYGTAVTAALRYGRHRHLGQEDTTFEPARLYIYYRARLMDESNPNELYKKMHDQGAELRNCIKSLHKYGVCPESKWPYSDEPRPSDEEWPEDAPACHPPDGVLADINHWRQYLGTSFSYYRIRDASSLDLTAEELATPPTLVQQLKRCLSSGFPFIFGFREYVTADLNEHVDEHGVFTKPPSLEGDKPTDKGGHAVMAVGYKTTIS